MTKELEFDAYSREALFIMERTNKNLFFTGKAGAGKSTIINYFISKTKKRFKLLGTTGISAQNINGETIHRFFGISVNSKLKTLSNEKIEEIQEADIFIIDEASMLRGDVFDAMNFRLKKACGNNQFLGGKQFIIVGDLYQLPPVVQKEETEFKQKYNSGFFFDSPEFINNFENSFELIELQKVFRQKDELLKNYLNAIREGYINKEILDFFNKKVTPKSEWNEKAVLIATRNSIVDKINQERNNSLPGLIKISKAQWGGLFEPDEFPTDTELNMKIGTRIMFVVNEKKGTYQNGTLGTIVGFSQDVVDGSDVIDIDIDGYGEVEIKKFTWKKYKQSKKKNLDSFEDDDEEEVIGYFKQYPFKLAFAITIHKVQGKTFDNVIIDMGTGAFECGQLYVALSRCTSYEGIQLVKEIKSSDVKASLPVKKFINTHKKVIHDSSKL